MDALYLLLKFVHIAAVVVWIGGLLALAVITARLARAGEGDALAAMRRQNRFFGQAVVGPAGGVALLAGLAMVGQAGWGFGSLWVVWGLVGFVVSMLLGAVPIRRAGEAVDALAPDDPRLAPLQSRLATLSAVNLLVLASVVWAMVFKPTL
jgi:uncharacterized membrane protein